MWRWVLDNWHKIGLILLAITHFWEKFEKMYNFVVERLPKRNKVADQEVKKPAVKMTKKDKLKLLQELISASYNEGYDEALDATLTHGDHPTKKTLKANSYYVERLFKQVKKEFDV